MIGNTSIVSCRASLTTVRTYQILRNLNCGAAITFKQIPLDHYILDRYIKTNNDRKLMDSPDFFQRIQASSLSICKKLV